MRLLLLVVTIVMAAFGEQVAIVVDRSDSMAGYAVKPSGVQVGSALRRIATILSSVGPVRIQGFSGPRQLQQPLHTLSLSQAEELFFVPTHFSGNTPLQAVLDRVIAEGAENLMFVTDGMEDGGAIERLADLLRALAAKQWRIGISAVMLPFEGIYYTEGVIPEDFLTQVGHGLPNQAWTVRRVACARPGTCYFFKGQRPLLFILLSRTDLSRLFTGVRAGLNENKIHVHGEVQLAPAPATPAIASIEAPHATRQHVRLPSSVVGTMVCAQPEDTPLHVAIRISPPPGESWPLPSRVSLSSFRAMEQPGWVVAPAKAAQSRPDGSIELDFQIRCLNQGSFFSTETTLKGKYQLELRPSFDATASGWWTESSAPNPWQYPYKVYKLDYLTRQIHLAALKDAPVGPIRVSLELKVRH